MKLPKPIIYITPEIERAIGTEPSDDYKIITNRYPYEESVQARYPDSVILVDNPTEEQFGTAKIIESPEAKTLVEKTGASILVFKNTARIEPLLSSRGWTLLNPSASLSEQIENKLTQIEWLGDLRRYLPEHWKQACYAIRWTGRPIIVQWGHGHTGDGTILIQSEEDLKNIQARFPKRMARVSEYIKGPSFTVNAVVSKDKILMSSVSYQITGLAPFTEKRFATIGNDWHLPKEILTIEQFEEIENIVKHIGTKLNISGWRGLFGVDLILDEARNKILLIEINARQPASTTFESYLQDERRKKGTSGITTFEAHLYALLNESINEDLIPIDDGAQIIQRVTNSIKNIPQSNIDSLKNAGYEAIPYTNSRDNDNLIRIQSRDGIMAGHGDFNENGKKILELISL